MATLIKFYLAKLMQSLGIVGRIFGKNSVVRKFVCYYFQDNGRKAYMIVFFELK